MNVFFSPYSLLKRLLILFYIVSFGVFTAQAQSFANFTVIPTGDQIYDLATSTTDLPQGGSIIDQSNKLTLSANTMKYQEGIFINATGAYLEGEFGSLTTPNLRFDLANQLLSTDSLELSYKNLIVTATTMRLYTRPSIAKLEGRVLSSNPSFEASGLVINLKTGFAFLLSPFEYQNGPLALRQETPGRNLQLSPVEQEDGSIIYQATSVIDPALLESFSPYLSP